MEKPATTRVAYKKIKTKSNPVTFVLIPVTKQIKDGLVESDFQNDNIITVSARTDV